MVSCEQYRTDPSSLCVYRCLQ